MQRESLRLLFWSTVRKCPKPHPAACLGDTGGAVLDTSGEHSNKQLGPLPTPELRWHVGADGHWLFAGMLWGSSSGWLGHQGDWPAPGQRWQFTEQMMPSCFTPHPAPWWLRSVDYTESNVPVLAGSILTFSVTAGASLVCLPLCFQD